MVTEAEASTSPQHRQLTAIFCDIVDSTALAAESDPEDWNSYLASYHEICAREVVRFGGFISYIAGDGVSAYFGFPRAFEGAGQRAVETALAIRYEFGRVYLSTGRRATLRIGVATEDAIVGGEFQKGTFQQTRVSGLVGHLAQRLEALAAPGEILISKKTHELVSTKFEITGPNLFEAKGLKERLEAWKIGRRTAPAYGSIRGSTEVRSKSSSNAFGREIELGKLSDAWTNSNLEIGAQATIIGDPGIGKSELLRSFHQKVRPNLAASVVLYGSEIYSNTPLYPVLSFIRASANLAEEKTSGDRINALENFFPRGSDRATIIAAYSFLYPEEEISLEVSPREKTRLFFNLLESLLVEASEYGRLLFIVEDLHWLDRTTVAFLEHCKPIIAESNIFQLVTSRSKISKDIILSPNTVQIELDPVSEEAAHEILQHMDGAGKIDLSGRKRLIERSDCIPFFLCEMTRVILDNPSTILDTIASASIRDLLQSRFDSLDPNVREMLHTAAVFGMPFTADFIAKVLEGAPREVRNSLLLAINADFIKRRTEETAWFTHALMQEQIYFSLMRSDRQATHARIAKLLEFEASAEASIDPEFLAHHWELSTHPDRSIGYWLKAGSNALANSAPVEAKHYFRRGKKQLALLETVSAGVREMRFNINLGLGRANYVASGPSADETVEAFNVAMDDVDVIDDPFRRCSLIYGVFAGYHFASRFPETRRTIAEMRKLAETVNNNEIMCQAHRMSGYVNFFTGDFQAMDSDFAAIQGIYVGANQQDLTTLFGADCLVAALGFQAVADAYRSDDEACVELARQNIARSLDLGHKPTIAWAYTALMYVGYVLDRPHLVQEIGAFAIPFCEENQIGAWLAHSRFLDAWANDMVSTGTAPSLDSLNEAYGAASEALQLGLPLFRAAIAKVLLKKGNYEEAIDNCLLAEDLARTSGQFVFLPEPLLLQGVSLLEQKRIDSAKEALWNCKREAERSGLSRYVRAAQELLAETDVS